MNFALNPLTKLSLSDQSRANSCVLRPGFIGDYQPTTAGPPHNCLEMSTTAQNCPRLCFKINYWLPN